MKSAYGLPAFFLGAVVVISQPYVAHAQANVARIRDVAQSTTVFIQSLNRPDVFGSGVIINRSGRTYSVLTAKHVVALADDYIVTISGQKYAVRRESQRQMGGVDLAVLQFETDQPLSVAQMAASAPKELDRIFVAGYPQPTASVTSIEFSITPGDVNTIVPPSQAKEGYGVRYGARTRVGMSGGPVLNEQAQLVAIHGRADELGGLAIPVGTYQQEIMALLQPSAQVALGGGGQPQAEQQERQRQLAEQEKQKQAQLAEQERQRQAQQAAQEKQRLAAQQAEEKQRLAAQQTQAANQQNQQLVALARIDPFAPDQPAVSPSAGQPEETCEWVSFGGTRIRRCAASGGGGGGSAPALPDFATFLNRGNELAAAGRYDQAVVEYGRALTAKSDYAYAYFNRGLSLAKLGQADSALADLRRAADLFQAQGRTSELARVNNTIAIVNRSRTVT